VLITHPTPGSVRRYLLQNAAAREGTIKVGVNRALGCPADQRYRPAENREMQP
jgi:hypothetical protein